MKYLKGVEFLTLLPAVVKFFTKHMKKEGNFWFTVLGYSDGKVTVAAQWGSWSRHMCGLMSVIPAFEGLKWG